MEDNISISKPTSFSESKVSENNLCEAYTTRNASIDIKLVCENCKEANFVDEDGFKYCTNCGHGFELPNFVNNYENRTFVADGVNYAEVVHYNRKGHTTGKSVPKGQRSGRNKIKSIGSMYETGIEKINDAKQLFDVIFPSMKSKPIGFKDAVAACCMYKVLTDCGVPVLLHEYISNSHCSPKLFHKALRLVKQKFGTSNQGPNQKDMISVVLRNGPLKDKDLSEVVNKTEEILKLAEECWLLTGRSAVALIIACAFFAYRLFLMKKDRYWSKVIFVEFCRRFKITNQQTTAYKRIKELKHLFITLAQNPCNPFYDQSSQLDVSDIEKHLNYILTCSSSIIKNVKNTASNDQDSKSDFVPLEMFREKKTILKYPETSTLTDERARYLNNLDDKDLMSDAEMKEYIYPPDIAEKHNRIKEKIHKGIPLIGKNSESVLYNNLSSYRAESIYEELIANSSDDTDHSNELCIDI